MDSDLNPRTGWMKATIMPNGNMNVQTGGDATMAEMIFALEWARDTLMQKLRGASGQGPLPIIPGMLTGDLKRVPVPSN